MARSFANVKTVASCITTQVSALVTRRGFAAAASQSGTVSSGLRNGAPNAMLKKGSEESGKSTWGPDPVTGYYRPDNHAKEIDAAELRHNLVENKTQQ